MEHNDKKKREEEFLNVISKLLNIIICLMVLAAVLVYINIAGIPEIFLPKKEIPPYSQQILDKENKIPAADPAIPPQHRDSEWIRTAALKN